MFHKVKGSARLFGSSRWNLMMVGLVLCTNIGKENINSQHGTVRRRESRKNEVKTRIEATEKHKMDDSLVW